MLVREVQQLPEIARQGLDRQLADGNLDVGLQRGGDVAAPRLLRVRDALDRVDRVQQPLGDDGGRIPAIDQLARDFDRVKHDGVAAKLAPKRIEQRRKQADQHDRQQDREHRRDILREPRQEVLLGAVGAEAEEERLCARRAAGKVLATKTGSRCRRHAFSPRGRAADRVAGA